MPIYCIHSAAGAVPPATTITPSAIGSARLRKAAARKAGINSARSLGQFEQAYIAENNARRMLNGEAPLPMTGITLQQRIAAEAVSEQRNEHGIPWLPQ
jgi:hypothetical protein